MSRSAILEQVKNDRKDSIKLLNSSRLLDSPRLRGHIQQKSYWDNTRLNANIFKEFISSTEAYPLN